MTQLLEEGAWAPEQLNGAETTPPLAPHQPIATNLYRTVTNLYQVTGIFKVLTDSQG